MADEVDAVDLSLIVEFLKLDDVFAKGEVSFLEAGERD